MRPIYALALLALVTVAAYSGLRRNDFVYEDGNAVLNAAVLHHQPIAVDRTRWLSLLSHKLTYMASPTPQAAHAVNLVLHLANGLLVYGLAASMVTPWAAVVASGVFWLHPLQSESVAYAASRSELLGTFLVLAACLWAVGANGWRGHALTWGLVVLALCAKESTVVVVPLLAWLALVRGEKLSIWQAAAMTVPALALAGSVFYFDFTATSELGPLGYAATQATALWTYLATLVVPIGQTIDHDFDLVPMAARYGLLAVTVGIACCLGLATLTVWDGDARRGYPLWDGFPRMQATVFGAVWVLIALAPRFVMPTTEFIAEHHMYLPMVGICIAVGCAVAPREKAVWG